MRAETLAALSPVAPLLQREASAAARAAEAALRQRYALLASTALDRAGRARSRSDAFVRTVETPERRAATRDVREGDGGELRSPKDRTLAPRFHSARSSCALAVNAFAPWRLSPGTLRIDGIHGFTQLAFERRCPIDGVPGERTPPNLDVIAEGASTVAIESKLIEYLKAKTTATFSHVYDKPVAALADNAWSAAYRRLKESPHEFQCFGAAQMIKHYLGLKSTHRKRPCVLIYLFWEPTDQAAHRIFATHRAEVAEFASWVAGGDVEFRWLSYERLFSDWSGLAKPQWLAEHVRALRCRYDVSLGPLLKARTSARQPVEGS